METTVSQGSEELGPEAFRFTVFNINTENFPMTVSSHPEGDHDGLGDNPPRDAGFAVGGVKEHVGKRSVRQVTAAECFRVRVQLLADPRHLRLRNARIRAECFHEVIDFPCGYSVNIRLHYDRVERVIDTSSPLQQRRK